MNGERRDDRRGDEARPRARPCARPAGRRAGSSRARRSATAAGPSRARGRCCAVSQRGEEEQRRRDLGVACGRSDQTSAEPVLGDDPVGRQLVGEQRLAEQLEPQHERRGRVSAATAIGAACGRSLDIGGVTLGRPAQRREPRRRFDRVATFAHAESHHRRRQRDARGGGGPQWRRRGPGGDRGPRRSRRPSGSPSTASTRSRSASLHPFAADRVPRAARAAGTSPSTSTSGEFFGIVGRNGSGKSTPAQDPREHLPRRRRAGSAWPGGWRRSSSWAWASTPS